MLQYPLSLISAASLHVALEALGHADTYPKVLRKHSGYSLEQVLPCAQAVVELMQRAPEASLKAVYKKYCSTKFGEAAKQEPPTLSQL